MSARSSADLSSEASARHISASTAPPQPAHSAISFQYSVRAFVMVALCSGGRRAGSGSAGSRRRGLEGAQVRFVQHLAHEPRIESTYKLYISS
jgi:hypothetical protein